MLGSRFAARLLRHRPVRGRKIVSGRLVRRGAPQQRRLIRTQAAVARSADEPFTVEEVELREPQNDEVLVKVHASGLCHTDIVVKTLSLCSFPIVLGHEGAGVVEAVGPAVKSGIKKGDRVLMTYASCGECPHCAAAKPAYCFEHGAVNFAGTRWPSGEKTHKFPADKGGGELFGSFFQQSSFASHALAGERNVIRLDEAHYGDADLARLAPLGCGVQTGAGAVLRTLQASAGESVAVFGCGAVGLSAIMAASGVSRCKHVVAVDVNDYRLEVAKELGATHVINPTKLGGDADANLLPEALREASDGGLNYAIDTSGVPGVVRSAFDALKPLGVCGVIAGAPPGVEVGIEILSMLPGKQLRGIIQGDSVPSTFMPLLLDLNRSGLFPFDKLATYYDGGLEDINKAVQESKDPSGKVIKAVLKIA